jgi:hypothetical protein
LYLYNPARFIVLKLEDCFSLFDPISLERLSEVALMDRREEKFVIPNHWCDSIASELSDEFNVLEINGARKFDYHNLYFDTAGNRTLEDHLRGRKNRFKIRIRSYISSGLTFLEVKKRNVYGRSVKKRIKRECEVWDAALTEKELDFLRSHLSFADELQPSLYSKYSRYTLACIKRNERITFDTDLQFTSLEGKTYRPLENLRIVELKQEKTDRRSPLHIVFRNRNDRLAPLGRALRISKYLIGRLHTDEKLESRTYLSSLKKLNRATLVANNKENVSF